MASGKSPRGSAAQEGTKRTSTPSPARLGHAVPRLDRVVLLVMWGLCAVCLCRALFGRTSNARCDCMCCGGSFHHHPVIMASSIEKRASLVPFPTPTSSSSCTAWPHSGACRRCVLCDLRAVIGLDGRRPLSPLVVRGNRKHTQATRHEGSPLTLHLIIPQHTAHRSATAWGERCCPRRSGGRPRRVRPKDCLVSPGGGGVDVERRRGGAGPES